MNSALKFSRSTIVASLLVLVLTLSTACANSLAGNANSGYSSTPSTAASPTIASSSDSNGNAVTALAQARWKAIAQGDLATVMSQYGDAPKLNWIGGPLNGEYQGKEKIQAVWGKFIKAQAPLKVQITNLRENADVRGTKTVNAAVTFSNAKTKIPVDYTLIYKPVADRYQVVEETWKISQL